MKRFFFFGEEVVPLRRHIMSYKEQLREIRELQAKICTLGTKLDQALNEYNLLFGKYDAIRKHVPARGKDGRFTKK